MWTVGSLHLGFMASTRTQPLEHRWWRCVSACVLMTVVCVRVCVCICVCLCACVSVCLCVCVWRVLAPGRSLGWQVCWSQAVQCTSCCPSPRPRLERVCRQALTGTMLSPCFVRRQQGERLGDADVVVCGHSVCGCVAVATWCFLNRLLAQARVRVSAQFFDRVGWLGLERWAGRKVPFSSPENRESNL